MSPLDRLFDEIYRNHWAMTLDDKQRVRRHGEVPTWRRARRAPGNRG